MLTLITGTPGAGKSLYTVWEIARKVPASTIPTEAGPIPRRLLSNIKGLLLDHEKIGAEELNNWQTWAKAGDVIVFDEVQEVWRPRSLSSKVPDCIAALETHRHMGVDIVLITQHPMLVDPNVRRLVNQHVHMRRVTKTLAMVYEWDSCNPLSSLKGSINTRSWWHPKAAYGLYKSAEAHTKPTARIPKILWLGVAALAMLAYMVPVVYGRIGNTFNPDQKQPGQIPASVAPIDPASLPPLQTASAPAPVLPEEETVSAAAAIPEEAPAGCIVTAKGCGCFDAKGVALPPVPAMCEALQNSPPPASLAQLDEPSYYRPKVDPQTSAIMFGVNTTGQAPRSTY